MGPAILRRSCSAPWSTTCTRLRRPNPAYEQVEYAIARARRRGDREAVRALRQHRRSLPSQDPNDPDYRRLRYVRYADDWLLGFAGPKREAREIKWRSGTFLRDELKLELSESKTLITHATTGAARFLGYEIKAQHGDDKLDRRGQRAVNGAIGLFVHQSVIGQRRVFAPDTVQGTRLGTRSRSRSAFLSRGTLRMGAPRRSYRPETCERSSGASSVSPCFLADE